MFGALNFDTYLFVENKDDVHLVSFGHLATVKESVTLIMENETMKDHLPTIGFNMLVFSVMLYLLWMAMRDSTLKVCLEGSATMP